MSEEKRSSSGARPGPGARASNTRSASGTRSASSAHSASGRSSGSSGSRPAENRGSSGRAQPRRRKRKSDWGVRLSGALLYILFVVGTAALLATLGWVWAGDVLALNKPEHAVTITLPDNIFTNIEVEEKVQDGDTEQITKKQIRQADMDYVADLLEENGLIEYKFLFKLFAKFTHGDQKITPGTYKLSTDMDYRALLLNMGRNSTTREEVDVTIPEGYTLDQIFVLLQEKGVASVEDLENMAATYDYKFTWLKGVIPLGDYHRLEGYLFPDTYKFYVGDDPKYVINKMLANFERKMEKYFDTIEEQGYTLAEIVAIASMIERETDGDDQSRIASVIYNRLQNTAAETNGYLQIDATLVYINGGNIPTEEDKQLDSPYNTYLYPGLPAGPIANPGMNALYAALAPDTTDFYYYVLGDDNIHHFFTTYQRMQNFMASQERYGG